ncbi:hypothetical protein [Pseudoxanthomonas koreensis]|uniref:hypothetical protein n=1 Tax=Pseudoxanthomonas koreensis TaxID=266061 RepID=UPI0035A739E3
MNTPRFILRWSLALLAGLALLPAFAAPRMTGFDPARHGFAFVNSFDNDVVRELDIRTKGLCGGMTYAALDYYNARAPIPRQTHRPAVNTKLHDFIYDRQVNSIADNADKWAELGFNPFGARNGEFFNWGLQGFNGGRLQELRAKIDRGQPVPLGLWHYDGHSGGDHQVLAIGYDTGRYTGDLGRYREDLKIFIYDPNYPNETKVLVPDLRRGGYRYQDEDKLWLTYFVDGKYRASRPPAPEVVQGAVPVRPSASASARPAVRATKPGTQLPAKTPAATGLTTRELLLTIHTGNDDLRGGSDNADVMIRVRGLPPVQQRNINGGRRWLGNYDQTVRIALPRAVPLEDLTELSLVTRFGGGIGGDNWNVDAVRVVAVTGEGERELANVSGSPLVRFTGQLHNHRIALSPR